jgi:Helix-turn-helix domain
MSIEALNFAFKFPIKKSAQKLVFICLANYANESYEAYPSVARLVEITSLDRKTVINSLGALVREGLICDTGRRCGKTKQIIIYQIVIKHPENGTLRVNDDHRRVPNSPPKSPVFPPKESQKRDTEPLLNHQPNPQKKGGVKIGDKRDSISLRLETLEEAKKILPKADIYSLEAEWRGLGRERPDNPDAAFLGWLRGFARHHPELAKD